MTRMGKEQTQCAKTHRHAPDWHVNCTGWPIGMHRTALGLAASGQTPAQPSLQRITKQLNLDPTKLATSICLIWHLWWCLPVVFVSFAVVDNYSISLVPWHCGTRRTWSPGHWSIQSCGPASHLLEITDSRSYLQLRLANNRIPAWHAFSSIPG